LAAMFLNMPKIAGKKLGAPAPTKAKVHNFGL